MSVKKLYKNGFARAVTLSFDDGNPQDMRVIEIMDNFGIKGTFNLMGGKCNNPCFRIKENGICLWDNSERLRRLYKNHEVASHGFNHLDMTEIDEAACKEEIEKDVAALYNAFGYKMRGFAAPYGRSDEKTVNTLIENGICYTRLTGKKKDFTVPEDFYAWKPNGHIADFMKEDGNEIISEFFKCGDELPLLYIWGHSYELTDMDCAGCDRWDGMRNRWERFENLCEKLSNHSDTWYATNIEICDYVSAMKKARVSDNYIDNLTDTELYFNVNGRLIVAPPHSRFGL